MDESQPNALTKHLMVLETLRVDGVLSDDEFQKIKKRLLNKHAEVAPDAPCEQAIDSTRADDQQQPPTEVSPVGDPYRIVKALVRDALIAFGFGFAGVAPDTSREQATESTRHDDQQQFPTEVPPVSDPYRIVKTLVRDALIAFGFGFAGTAIVALVFHFRLRPSAAIAPLALANALSYTLGFSVLGFRASGEQYWRRLIYVAIFAWLASIIDVALLGLSITSWALSSIWIAVATATGGGIGRQLRGVSKESDPVKNASDRWNWRRIPLRTLLIAAGSAAATVTFGTSYIAYDHEPKPQTTYSNLKLGMTMQQVKNVKGRSPLKVGEFQGAKDEDVGQGGTSIHDFLTQRAMLLFDTIKLPNGKHVEDYTMWAYASTDKHTILRVDFDPNTKALIGISCVSLTYSEANPFEIMGCQDLLGIQDRWSEDALVKKLGNPTEEKSDGDVEIFRYNDLGVQYFFARGYVFMLSLFPTL